jgi:hypothetical protein
MTLLLGALTSKAVVLGADAIEFRHAPRVPKRQDLLDRQKLFHLDDYPLAVGVHGQNRLVSQGGSVDSQWLAIDVLPMLVREIDHGGTVERLCRALFNRLMSDVTFTFKTLNSAGIAAAPLGILVVGFDQRRNRPQCYEAWWPLPAGHEQPRVIEHPQDRRIPAVVHSGEGARHVKTAIAHGGRYSVDRLKKTSLKETQQYVRTLYKKAERLQPRDQIEFGGAYHEITVTPDRSQWSFNLSPNKAFNPAKNAHAK